MRQKVSFCCMVVCTFKHVYVFMCLERELKGEVAYAEKFQSPPSSVGQNAVDYSSRSWLIDGETAAGESVDRIRE